MKNDYFKQDLLVGEAAEVLFMETYLQKYPEAKVKKNEGTTLSDMRKYDIEVIKDGVTKTYEIKWDRLAPKTGNIAVESKCLGYTESDYFVILVGEELFLGISVSALRNLVKSKKFPKVAGGREGNEMIYLIPRKVFEIHSTPLMLTKC